MRAGIRAGLTAMVLTSLFAAAPAAARTAGCVPKMNVEAIVDDSSSMLSTDPEFLRVAALDKFVHTPGPTRHGGNQDKVLGATEFSGESKQLFPPIPIGGNGDGITAVLQQQILGDGTTGTSTGTDYNDAFAGAGANNPTATARIFLTDGGHLTTDDTAYNEAHRGGPPTYVLGFGSSITQTDSDRLARIAAETGGQYFPATDNTTLQANLGTISSALSCVPPPRTQTQTFSQTGETQKESAPVPPGSNTANLSISWTSTSDEFNIRKVVIKRNGKTVAGTTKKFKSGKRLGVDRESGETFVSLLVDNLRKGKLKFLVRANTIGSFSPEVTTQTVVLP